MPAVIPFIPLIAAGVGTAGSVYAANKAANAAKPDPTTQAMQNAALAEQQKRSKMFDPMMAMLATQAQNRLPQSMRGGAPSIGQMRSPYAGQAISQLARGLPGPGGQRRQRYQDMA